MEELKNELDKTRNIVRVQRLRYQQLVSLFSAKLQEKEEETRNDLQIKHIQLTRILRALYILEAKLRKEQRSLKSTLIERDTVIRTQQHEITKLTKELDRISRNRCCNCVKLEAASVQIRDDKEPKNADNKPDLISSIGIETLKDANSPTTKEFEPVSNKLENDENTYVISSLDDYDASLSSLHVRGASDETKDFPQTGSVVKEHQQNANNENLRNRMIDQELQNEMRKFKMKEDAGKSSPRMILKEVTENPNEKLNGPVLKCVKQILSIDNENCKKPIKKTDNFRENSTKNQQINLENSISEERRHPAKPPKPIFGETQKQRFETNVSKAFLYENMLSVKPLPKAEPAHLKDRHGEEKDEHVYESISTDESKIVQTVSALLSDSGESEDEKSETSPTVSQMVKKFEGLKCKKKIIKGG